MSMDPQVRADAYVALSAGTALENISSTLADESFAHGGDIKADFTTIGAARLPEMEAWQGRVDTILEPVIAFKDHVDAMFDSIGIKLNVFKAGMDAEALLKNTPIDQAAAIAVAMKSMLPTGRAAIQAIKDEFSAANTLTDAVVAAGGSLSSSNKTIIDNHLTTLETLSADFQVALDEEIDYQNELLGYLRDNAKITALWSLREEPGLSEVIDSVSMPTLKALFS